jgi:IS4 transposase
MSVIRSCSRFREVAQLYARRWDIEMAFRVLKEYLGMSHWWSSKQELILIQIWVVLILSHIVYALTRPHCHSRKL